MIDLGYEFHPEEVVVRWDWSAAPAWAYAYDAFPGDIRLIVDGKDLSANWGWVTILYFALCLRRAVADLEVSGIGVVEFTESELALNLRIVDRCVEIRADWVTESVIVQLDELRRAAVDLLAQVRADFEQNYPSTLKNPHYRDFLDKFE